MKIFENIMYAAWAFAAIVSFAWIIFPFYLAIKFHYAFMCVFSILTIPTGALFLFFIYESVKELKE
jgi:hypothetical protein